VPRSFFTGGQSMAGYIAPVRHNKNDEVGNEAADERAPTFSEDATFCCLISNGRTMLSAGVSLEAFGEWRDRASRERICPADWRQSPT